jgi:hypothetical protein
MKAMRLLCQFVTLLMCFIGLALAHIGGAMCRAADRLNKVVKL